MAMLNPRVGVFLCRCNGQSEDKFDIDEVAEEVARLRNVKHVEVENCMCTERVTLEIQKAIDASELDSVVIGGCVDKIDLKDLRQSLVHKIREPRGISVVDLLGPSLHAHGESYEDATRFACQAVCDAVSEAGLVVVKA